MIFSNIFVTAYVTIEEIVFDSRTIEGSAVCDAVCTHDPSRQSRDRKTDMMFEYGRSSLTRLSVKIPSLYPPILDLTQDKISLLHRNSIRYRIVPTT